jgi:hypothetical protein
MGKGEGLRFLMAGLCAIGAAARADNSDSGRGNVNGASGQAGAGGAGAPAAASTGATIFAAMHGDAFRRFGLGFDGAGRIAVAGEFDNTVDFGTGPLTPPGQPTTGSLAPPLVPDNVYVLKLAPCAREGQAGGRTSNTATVSRVPPRVATTREIDRPRVNARRASGAWQTA